MNKIKSLFLGIAAAFFVAGGVFGGVPSAHAATLTNVVTRYCKAYPASGASTTTKVSRYTWKTSSGYYYSIKSATSGTIGAYYYSQGNSTRVLWNDGDVNYGGDSLTASNGYNVKPVYVQANSSAYSNTFNRYVGGDSCRVYF